jgi:hypothetical protein
VQGELLINQGHGFQQVSGPVQINPGDLAMVNPGGLAMVGYPDGCKVNLQPGVVMTITPSSPCTNPFGGPNPPTYAQDTGLVSIGE